MTKFQPGNTRGGKLSNEQVFELRQKYASGRFTQAQLCREYGLHINTIGKILRGESYQRVPLPADPPETIRDRLMVLQEHVNQQSTERLTDAIQKEYDATVKPKRTLDRFINREAAEQFGAHPTTEEDK